MLRPWVVYICSPHIERTAYGEVSAAGNAGDGETRIALAFAARVAEREARPAEQSHFSAIRHFFRRYRR